MQRTVPFSVKLKCVAGGALVQFGCLGLCFFAIFLFTLGGQIRPLELFQFWGQLSEAPGTVLSVEKTNARESKRSVMAFGYTFKAGDQSFYGKSYSSSQRLSVGQNVSVEFDPAHPEISRIKGLRAAMISVWFILLLIPLSLIGIIPVFLGIRRGIRTVSLLTNGEFGKAKLVGRRGTNMQINNRPVIELSFEYTGRDGQKHQFTTKTSIPEKITDDAEEKILFDPDIPSRAILLDSLPVAVQFDPTGQNVEASGSLLCLALPVMTLYVYGVGIWWVFLRSP